MVFDNVNHLLFNPLLGWQLFVFMCVTFQCIFVVDNRLDEAKLSSPVCDNGQDEALRLFIISALILSKVCILQQRMVKHRDNDLRFLQYVFEGRQQQQIFDQELYAVRVARDE